MMQWHFSSLVKSYLITIIGCSQPPPYLHPSSLYLADHHQPHFQLSYVINHRPSSSKLSSTSKLVLTNNLLINTTRTPSTPIAPSHRPLSISSPKKPCSNNRPYCNYLERRFRFYFCSSCANSGLTLDPTAINFYLSSSTTPLGHRHHIFTSAYCRRSA